MWVFGWLAALAALVGKRMPPSAQKSTEGPAKATRRRPDVSTQASVQAPTASIAWRTQPYLSNAVGSVEAPPARHSPAWAVCRLRDREAARWLRCRLPFAQPLWLLSLCSPAPLAAAGCAGYAGYAGCSSCSSCSNCSGWPSARTLAPGPAGGLRGKVPLWRRSCR